MRAQDCVRASPDGPVPSSDVGFAQMNAVGRSVRVPLATAGLLRIVEDQHDVAGAARANTPMTAPICPKTAAYQAPSRPALLV